MQNYIRINDDFSVGSGQPEDETLAALQQEGFRSVVNLRTRGEGDDSHDPDREGEIARDLGLEYAHIPVSTDEMGAGKVDQFRERVSQLPKPVYVHCGSGKRSGAFTMMHVAVQQGMSGETTLDQAEQLGFECDTENLKNLVRDYVDRRQQT